MMKNLKILNSKKVKEILKMLKDQWGFDSELDYAFLLSSKDNIYIINREFADLDTSNIKINALGMYFAELKNNELRLSIEASQIIGPLAKKNILDLSDKLARLWLKGYDLPLKDDQTHSVGFQLIRNNEDFMGCGKVKASNLLNFVPKTRRIYS